MTPPRLAPRAAGFTLLEVMVVVVIVGLLAGFSALAINQASDRPLRGEAERFADWLQMVGDSALLQGVAYGLGEDDKGWQLLVFYRQQWWPAAQPEPFEWRLPAALRFQAESAALSESAATLLSPNQNDQLTPSVALLPNGGLTPAGVFIVAFTERDSRWQISPPQPVAADETPRRFTVAPLAGQP